MDIAGWRKKIDEIDRKLVELLNQRAQAAHEIGRLKRNTTLPIYEPDRERIVFDNVKEINRGPLPGRDLAQIYERIMDVMRNIQKEEIAPEPKTAISDTELESDVNDRAGDYLNVGLKKVDDKRGRRATHSYDRCHARSRDRRTDSA